MMENNIFWFILGSQLLSCWAWSTVTFEGKGLTYSPLVSYVFSMLHYRISTHQYFFFIFTWRRSSVGNIFFVNRTFGTVPTIVSFFYRSFTRNEMPRPRTDASTRCPPSFFFFYLVWWHLTLITPETPWHCPDHTISTALLSGSCVS